MEYAAQTKAAPSARISPRRIQFQNEGSVCHDEEDTRKGGGKTQEETAGKAFPLQQEMSQKGCEERNHCHDNPHIGGKGMGQGDVFQQEVQGNPVNPAPANRNSFFQPENGRNRGFQAPEKSISYYKAGEEYRDGCEIPQKHLGGDESRSPDENGHEGGCMAQGTLAGTHCIMVRVKGAFPASGPEFPPVPDFWFQTACRTPPGTSWDSYS